MYTKDNPLRVFSFGGGVQSHAVLALQIQGKLDKPFDYFVFANVGNDSENPHTLTYMENHTIPLCKAHNIPMIEVRKTKRDGTTETLMEYMNRSEKSIPIPVRMSNGSPGNRSCTTDFKIKVVDKFCKTTNADWIECGLGISLDEWKRAKDEQWHDTYKQRKLGFNKRRIHPLLDMRIKRIDCHKIIESIGIPVPPASSCFFCPYHRKSAWIDLHRDDPGLFAKSVDLENMLNDRRKALGRDPIYLHSSIKPLDQAITATQLSFLDDLDNCDGYCHT